jgi:hypothetical protein
MPHSKMYSPNWWRAKYMMSYKIVLEYAEQHITHPGPQPGLSSMPGPIS